LLFPVCLPVKHLQRLAALLRHAIRLLPLLLAIRLPPLRRPRLTPLHFPQQTAPLERFPLLASHRLHATRLPLPPAIPAATLAATLATNPVAFQPPLAVEPAPTAAALAATVFANAMAALILSSGN
jgi:hypothetical protein